MLPTQLGVGPRGCFRKVLWGVWKKRKEKKRKRERDNIKTLVQLGMRSRWRTITASSTRKPIQKEEFQKARSWTGPYEANKKQTKKKKKKKKRRKFHSDQTAESNQSHKHFNHFRHGTPGRRECAAQEVGIEISKGSGKTRMMGLANAKRKQPEKGVHIGEVRERAPLGWQRASNLVGKYNAERWINIEETVR